MTINKSNDTVPTFALAGRLDTTTAPQLQDAIIPAFDETRDIILDFADIEYVSSAGLRVLLLGTKAAKAAGGSQTLVNVPPEVMEVFELTGFDGVLTFG